MAFKAELSFSDSKKKYIVLECDYEYTQEIDITGKPCARPKGGVVNVVVESTNDAELVMWMTTTGNVRSGTITFFSKDNNTKLKTLTFKEAYCFRLHEKFSHQGDSPMITSFSFTTKEMELDTVNYKAVWTHL